jgi:Universal stress protein UspA and related nucleotide-binding proteins
VRVFNKILAAVDISESLEYVKSWSEGFGESMNSQVDYITVFQVVPEIYQPLVGWNRELENNLNLAKKDLFSNLEDILRRDGYNLHELEGEPDEVITSFAKENNHSLIIIGFRGSGKSRIPVGSTALNVAKESHTNVLLVNNRFKPIRKIAVAEGLKNRSKSALLMVFALAKLFGSKVYRIHVIDKHFVDHSPEDLLQELKFELNLELQKSTPGVQVEAVILEGDPSFELFYWTTKNDVDLTVLFERPGRLGLVSEEFLMQTTTPVLICRGI